jgi:coenzyme F420-dependent glucose-6-phosphate dehydrogenase
MVELGYALSSEEHAPRDLVGFAKRAEETGFSFALISDHYHPWTSRQGHSPFAWGVIGVRYAFCNENRKSADFISSLQNAEC